MNYRFNQVMLNKFNTIFGAKKSKDINMSIVAL